MINHLNWYILYSMASRIEFYQALAEKVIYQCMQALSNHIASAGERM